MQNPLHKLRGVEAEPIQIPETQPTQGSERQSEVFPQREQLKDHSPSNETEQSTATLSSTPSAAASTKVAVPHGVLIVPLETIEKILEQDMQNIYQQLPPDVKPIFKARAEEAARNIQQLLQKAKTTISQLREIILRWLQVIPGVNKFFIEQEAKLKAEKIFRLRKRNKKV